jgi:hypothetical protein
VGEPEDVYVGGNALLTFQIIRRDPIRGPKFRPSARAGV